MSRQETVSEKLIDLSFDGEESTSSESTTPPPVIFANPGLTILPPELPGEPIGFKFKLDAGWVTNISSQFDKYSSYHTAAKLSLQNNEEDETIATCDTAINEATAELEKEPSPQLIVILLYFHYTNEKMYEMIEQYAKAKNHCEKAISLLNSPTGKKIDLFWPNTCEKLIKCFEIIYISLLNFEGKFEEAYKRLDLIKHLIRNDIEQILLQNIANQSSTGDAHKKSKDEKSSHKEESKLEATKPMALPVTLFYEFDEKNSIFGVGAKWSEPLPETLEKFRAATKKSILSKPKEESISLLTGYIKELSNKKNIEEVSVLIIMHRTLALIYKNHDLPNKALEHYLTAQVLINKHSLPKEWEIGNCLNLYTLNLSFKDANNEEIVRILRVLLSKVDFKPFERDILIKKLPAEYQKQFAENSDSTKLMKKARYKAGDSDSATEVKSDGGSAHSTDALQSVSPDMLQLTQALNSLEMQSYSQILVLMSKFDYTTAIKKCDEMIVNLEKSSSHLESPFKNFSLFVYNEMKAVAIYRLSEIQVKNGSVETAFQNAKLSLDTILVAEKYLDSLDGRVPASLRFRHMGEKKKIKEWYSLFEEAKKYPNGIELLNILALSFNAQGFFGNPSTIAPGPNPHSIWQQPTAMEEDEDEQMQRAIELSKKDTHGSSM